MTKYCAHLRKAGIWPVLDHEDPHMLRILPPLDIEWEKWVREHKSKIIAELLDEAALEADLPKPTPFKPHERFRSGINFVQFGLYNGHYRDDNGYHGTIIAADANKVEIARALHAWYGRRLKSMSK